MKNNMQRAAAVFLVIAGLTALNQSKTFQLHANPQACSASILLGGYGAGTTGLINNSSDPNDFTIGTFVPFAEAVRFVFDGGGKVSGSSTADFGGFEFSRNVLRHLFGEAELHGQSGSEHRRQHHSS